MPHLLIERTRWLPALLSVSTPTTPKWVYNLAEKGVTRHRELSTHLALGGAVVIELLDLSASVMFLAGSICFLPDNARNVSTFLHGCDLFVLGSLVYCVVTTYTLVEAFKTKGIFNFEAYENALYLAGAVSYLLGTLLYWPEPGHVAPFVAYMGDQDMPDMVQTPRDVLFEVLRATTAKTMATDSRHEQTLRSVQDTLAAQHKLNGRLSSGVLAIDVNMYVHEWTGSVLFIVGSLLFTLAAFANALKQRKFLEWNAVIISASSLYMAGSLQFVMGSVCFLPELGADWAMARFGAWCFISGSILYLLGNIISLTRTIMKLMSSETELLKPLRSSSLDVSDNGLPVTSY